MWIHVNSLFSSFCECSKKTDKKQIIQQISFSKNAQCLCQRMSLNNRTTIAGSRRVYQKACIRLSECACGKTDGDASPNKKYPKTWKEEVSWRKGKIQIVGRMYLLVTITYREEWTKSNERWHWKRQSEQVVLQRRREEPRGVARHKESQAMRPFSFSLRLTS